MSQRKSASQIRAERAEKREASTPTPVPERRPAQSGLGKLTQQGNVKLRERIQELEARVQDLSYLNPKDLTTGPLAQYNRTEDYFKSEEYLARKKSVEQRGIEESLVVRPSPVEEGKYEIISGHTRHRIALDLGLEKIPARVIEYDDKAAALRLATINEDRTEHTVYDKARLRKGMVDSGLYSSLADVMKDLGEPKAEFYSMMQILDLPKEIETAFGGLHRIEKPFWVRQINAALKSDKTATLSRAKELTNKSQELDPADIYKHIVGSKPAGNASEHRSDSQGKKAANYADREYLKIGGRELGFISRRGKSFQVNINKFQLNESEQDEFAKLTQQFLETVAKRREDEK